MTPAQSEHDVERFVGKGADDFDRVRSRVESLSRLGAPSLIIPSRVTMARGDKVAVTEPHRDHDTLRAVLDARGALKAGECVWLGVAVADALAFLHREGLVHGALDAEAIVLDHGRVRLARLVDGQDDASAADDVAALGRLLASAVRRGDADRIGAWTEPMTHQDPLGRPTAAMVVRALASCAPPEEVVVPAMDVASAVRRSAASKPEASRNGRAVPLSDSRGWRLRLRLTKALQRLGVVMAALGVVGALVTGAAWAIHGGLWSGDSGGREAAGTPAVAGERLTIARFDALSRGDGPALEALTIEGSPAGIDAERTSEALGSGRLKVDGLVGQVEDSTALDGPATGPFASGDTALVRVRYRVGPHVVTAEGDETRYDGYEQTVDLTIAWVDGRGWRVREAATVPQPGT